MPYVRSEEQERHTFVEIYKYIADKFRGVDKDIGLLSKDISFKDKIKVFIFY